MNKPPLIMTPARAARQIAPRMASGVPAAHLHEFGNRLWLVLAYCATLCVSKVASPMKRGSSRRYNTPDGSSRSTANFPAMTIGSVRHLIGDVVVTSISPSGPAGRQKLQVVGTADNRK